MQRVSMPTPVYVVTCREQPQRHIRTEASVFLTLTTVDVLACPLTYGHSFVAPLTWIVEFAHLWLAICALAVTFPWPTVVPLYLKDMCTKTVRSKSASNFTSISTLCACYVAGSAPTLRTNFRHSLIARVVQALSRGAVPTIPSFLRVAGSTQMAA